MLSRERGWRGDRAHYGSGYGMTVTRRFVWLKLPSACRRVCWLRTTDDYATFEDCMMYYTFFVDDYIVPWELPYDRIVLRTGGSDARRQERGWAAWTQEWPSTGATGSSGTASQFDVSDVDVTNFPELDCVEHSREFVHGQACFEWVENPELGIAGWYSSGWNSITYYVQVKAPPGQEGNVETGQGGVEASLRVRLRSTRDDTSEVRPEGIVAMDISARPFRSFVGQHYRNHRSGGRPESQGYRSASDCISSGESAGGRLQQPPRTARNHPCVDP